MKKTTYTISPAVRAQRLAAVKARWATRYTKPAKKASAGARTPKKKSVIRSQKSDLTLANPDTGAPAQGKALVPVDYQTEDTTLLLARLVPGVSVTNARTEFDEAYLTDLAASIEQHGVRSRLWVRPLAKLGKKGETHEIIAGECRWRAAQRTRHLMVPVTIYHVTPEQAEVLMLIENLQREDLNEIDEAFGFKKLIDRGWAAWNPADPEKSVGHKIGKSKTYIYAALKLCELPKLGLQAVRAGELSASVGVRIARIPNKEARMKALADAIHEKWTDDDAAEEIARHYITELKGAPFDRTDATLNPKRGACETCPYRSGNMAEMFEDMAKGRADICTDPACFRGKCVASFEPRAARHRAAGGKVLSAEEAQKAGLRDGHSSVGGEWADLDEPAYFLSGKANGKTPRALLKEVDKSGAWSENEVPIALALANDGLGAHYELITRDSLELLCQKAGLLKNEKGGNGSGAHAAQQRKYKAEAERGKAITRHSLGIVAAHGTAWAAEVPVFTGLTGPCPDDLYRLIHTITLWLIESHGPDALRLLCHRRQINPKDFQLDADQDTPRNRMHRGLATWANAASVVELIGLACELMAVPGFPHRDGTLDEDHAGVIAGLLTLDLDEIHAAAKTAVDEEAKAKLGGKKGAAKS